MSVRKPVTGLQLPPVSPVEQQNIHSQWDTIGAIEGEIAMKGFVPMDTPLYECPQITEELLTTADHDAYTAAFTQQLAWFNYASQVLAQATSHLLQYENEMEMIESRLRTTFREEISGGTRSKMTKEEMQDEINLDKRYGELKLGAQKYKQKKIQLQAYVEGIERGLRVISRQIEIRKMEMEQNRVNIPGRGGYQQGQNWGRRDQNNNEG